MQIHPLSVLEFARLVEGAELIQGSDRDLKVLRLADGRFLKYFRRKHLISRDLMVAAAIRFAQNARRLERLRIPTLKVLGLHRVGGSADTVAIYQPLAGTSLRDLLGSGQADAGLLYRVGTFIAQLHGQGVYFRSLHPGNIVIDDAVFGLIDLLDMRFRQRPLTRWERRRNWLHFLRTREDRPFLTDALMAALLAGYSAGSQLPERHLQRIADHVQRAHAGAL